MNLVEGRHYPLQKPTTSKIYAEFSLEIQYQSEHMVTIWYFHALIWNVTVNLNANIVKTTSTSDYKVKRIQGVSTYITYMIYES